MTRRASRAMLVIVLFWASVRLAKCWAAVQFAGVIGCCCTEYSWRADDGSEVKPGSGNEGGAAASESRPAQGKRAAD